MFASPGDWTTEALTAARAELQNRNIDTSRIASVTRKVMWKCPKCGEEIDDHFDSCWKCAKVESASESVDTLEPKQPSGGFWCAWWRGWYVFLMILVYSVVVSWLRAFYQQSVRTYFRNSGGPFVELVVLAVAVLLLPPCAYWIFILFFGREAWPSKTAPRELPREARAIALLDEATKLEVRGRVKEALAKYEAVVEKFRGTAASHDAQKSIESLRAKIG